MNLKLNEQFNCVLGLYTPYSRYLWFYICWSRTIIALPSKGYIFCVLSLDALLAVVMNLFFLLRSKCGQYLESNILNCISNTVLLHYVKIIILFLGSSIPVRCFWLHHATNISKAAKMFTILSALPSKWSQSYESIQPAHPSQF